MYITVKCPYCKLKQQICIDNDCITALHIYYDCQHCLECFEVVLKAVAKTVP